MKKIRQICCFVSLLVLLVSSGVGSAEAYANQGSGYYGEDETLGTWSVDNNGILHLSGGILTGGAEEKLPWHDSKTTIKKIVFDSKVSSDKSIRYLFSGLENLTSFDTRNFSTKGVQTMDALFSGDKNLKEVNLSSFDTSAVFLMPLFFSGCESLESVDLSHFDTSKVQSMMSFFANCRSLTALNLSNFKTENVSEMIGMFKYCTNLKTLDIRSFNTEKLKFATDMFLACNALSSLTLGPTTKLKPEMNLPEVQDRSMYTGGWYGVKTGTKFSSSRDFLANYVGGDQADEYRWQRKAPNTVKFVDDGVILHVEDALDGTKLQEIMPENPVKEGFEFKGWYQDDVCYTSSNIVNESLRLVAMWGEKSPEPPVTAVPLYRSYNKNNGEHLYTESKGEHDYLVSIGWVNEGRAWNAASSGVNVYRLYNPNSGEHFYTARESEYNAVANMGWRKEGKAFYSSNEVEGIPIYRLFNPNTKQAGSHHYTGSKAEVNWLVSLGWEDEGIAFYGVK